MAGRLTKSSGGSYYLRRQGFEEQTGDKTYNIQSATAERYGIRRNMFGEGAEPYSPFGPGYETIVAPTTYASFPRARVLGYNQETQTLVVIFRDGTWVRYDAPVPPDMWADLQYTDSTGKYLKYSGIDDLPYTVINSQDDLPRSNPDNMRMGQADGR